MENKTKDLIAKIEKELVLRDEVKRAGMNDESVAKMLMELCNWQTIKIDKNGEVHESVDGHLRLKALELWMKIMGVAKNSSDPVHNHLHLSGMNDGKLDDLARKARKTKSDKKESN